MISSKSIPPLLDLAELDGNIQNISIFPTLMVTSFSVIIMVGLG